MGTCTWPPQALARLPPGGPRRAVPGPSGVVQLCPLGCGLVSKSPRGVRVPDTRKLVRAQPGLRGVALTSGPRLCGARAWRPLTVSQDCPRTLDSVGGSQNSASPHFRVPVGLAKPVGGRQEAGLGLCPSGGPLCGGAWGQAQVQVPQGADATPTTFSPAGQSKSLWTPAASLVDWRRGGAFSLPDMGTGPRSRLALPGT